MENVRKIVIEEVLKAIGENIEVDNITREAQISSALSFMQDLKTSLTKLESQRELKTTNYQIDEYLDLAIENINKAINLYFSIIDPTMKSDVVERMGEVKMDV